MDTATLLLVIVASVSLGILGWAGRKRFPLRIGLGNFFRRKTQVAIVVSGLLIGTAIISSSYVIQSTFDFTVRSAVFRNLDHIDALVFVASPDGSRAPFSMSVFDGLRANLSNMPHVDGLAPRYQVTISVVNNDSRLFEPTANLIGFDPAYDLGSFVRPDGSEWDGSGLAFGDVILNRKLANAIEADIFNRLVVFIGTPQGTVPVPATVGAIVEDSGRGAFNDAANLFVPLDVVQAAVGIPGMINLVTVSNAGGVTEGYLVSDAAAQEIAQFLPATPTFTVSKVKENAIEESTQGVSQLSQLFTLLGTFTIVAGILLIINIFVMLAEERKGEMGVARALGMRRKNLVQSFVAEGLLYALLSAAVGAFAGLLVAGVILWAFAQIFPAEAFGGVRFVLTWTSADLIQAFAIGFLITMLTILAASVRVSKLNIVRAIRDIPEPVQHRSTRRQVAVGIVLAALGAILTTAAIVNRTPIFHSLGPSALAIGLAVVVMRATSPRLAFSLAGAFIVGWVLSPLRLFEVEASVGIELFIASGLLLVLGGLLVVLFNSDTLLSVVTRVVRRRTWLPVVRTAIAYPMNKKFRTGATLASIALIMFTIATMSGVQSMVASSIETTTLRESGGFDLIAQSNPAIPKTDWDGEYDASNVSANITEIRGISSARVRLSEEPDLSGGARNSSLLGVPQDWADVPFEFQALDANYPDGRAAWAAIQANGDLGIIDGTVIPQNFGPSFDTFPARVGDVFYYGNASGVVREVRIIGILYERFVTGIFVGWETAREGFGVDYPSVFYLKVAAGQDATRVGHDIERTFVHYQMLTFDIDAFINTILEVTMGVFNLLQAYLALGLIVGIAGLGVITMRNVVERRTETGALRAIGFRKSMILKSFLFELSFIALTGIAMGIVLGIALSYNLYLEFFEDQGPFVIPWLRLLVLGGIAFFGSVLATASPAIRASRMPPAEALRSFE